MTKIQKGKIKSKNSFEKNCFGYWYFAMPYMYI